MGWGDYWRRVCAPKLKAKKDELGRGFPERSIAETVQKATGKPSERALINMWLRGEREPFISQFLALCEKLGMDPCDVLRENNHRVRVKGDISTKLEPTAKRNKRRNLTHA